MTQDEQERDLEDIRTYLTCCTSLRVDRCRHESNPTTAVWIFDGKGRGGKERQIAVIARNEPLSADGRQFYPWRVSGLLHGQTISHRQCATMLDAVGEMMRVTRDI